jgi:uncharacterized MAPEG superfamily protein
MTTIELIPFDPTAKAATTKQQRRPRPFSLLDPGALAVLIILLMMFVAPLVLWGYSTDAHLRAGSGFELIALFWTVLLSLLLPLMQIFTQIRRFGGAAVRGNRDSYRVSNGVTGRIARAHDNLIESLVPFAAAVLAAQTLHVSNNWTVAAAGMYLVARLIHAFSYTLGITIIRSAAFYAGVVATVVIVCRLPLLPG